MRRIQRRSGNPRSMLVGEPGNIENMIEVTVGDEDSANRLMMPTMTFQFPSEAGPGTDEYSVDEMNSGVIPQCVEGHSGRADLKKIISQQHSRRVRRNRRNGKA